MEFSFRQIIGIDTGRIRTETEVVNNNGGPVNKLNQPKPKSALRISSKQGIDEAAAKLTATEYCLFHYPTLYTAGAPCLVSQKTKQVWVVPIVLASPTRGVLGEVGQLKIDLRSGQVIAATDRAEVVANGEQLFQRKSNAPAPAVPARK